MAKKIVERVEEIINNNTGEITSTVKTFVKESKSEDFIQLYLEDIELLYSLENLEFKLYLHLLKRCEFNTNKVVILKHDKEELSKDLNCTLGSINNAITVLVKKFLLLRRFKGCYVINPRYSFKGEFKHRQRVINHKIEIEPNKDFDNV